MKINRAERPKSKVKPMFSLPKFSSEEISNGIKYFYTTKKTLPIVSLTLFIGVGNRDIPEGKSGLAFLTGSLLLKGAGEYNAHQLTEKFQELGINITMSVEHEYYNIGFISLKDKFEEGISLLSDILLKPHFSEYEFNLAKKSLLTQLAHAQIDPGFISTIVANKIMLKNTSFINPLFGYPDTVEKLTNEDVKNFYAEKYSPENSKLLITGNITAEEIENLLSKYLANWKGENNHKTVSNRFAQEPKSLYFTHMADTPQSILEIGLKIKPRKEIDIFPLILANDILGGSFTSRLNKNLREDKGFTYGISSSYYFTEETGVFSISSSVEGINTINAIKEILHEINAFYGTVTTEELELAKSFIINHFPANFETYTKINGSLKNLVRYDLGLEYYENYIDSILKVTVEDVNKFISETFCPENFQVYVCGDKTNFIDKRDEIGFTDFTEVDVLGNPIIQ